MTIIYTKRGCALCSAAIFAAQQKLPYIIARNISEIERDENSEKLKAQLSRQNNKPPVIWHNNSAMSARTFISRVIAQ